MKTKLVEKVIHPLYHRMIRHDKLFDWFEFYQRSQWWPIEKIETFQWELLQTMLQHAYEHVPYYNQLFNTNNLQPKDFKDWEDFRKIPFLSKELISKNRDQISADNILGKRRVPDSTSGSTGINFHFISDRNAYITKQALQMRIDHWMNMSVADHETTIWGASWDVHKSRRPMELLRRYLKNKLILSANHLGDENMEKYLLIMRKIKSKFLHGYPSTLFRFAQYLEKKGVSFPLKGIRTAGETLYEFQRDIIEKVFETNIFNFYSSREISMIAQEDESHDGLYVQAENVILEVIDEKGDPIIDKEGEIVLTDLHNYVMPFIRYKIGDRGILSSNSGKCGRSLPMLKSVTGRTFDIITFSNGNAVGGTFWTLLLKSVKGIEYFQVVQTSLDIVLIRIVPNKDFKPTIYEILRKRIRDISGDKTEIKFSIENSIPLTAGGKMRYIISEIEN